MPKNKNIYILIHCDVKIVCDTLKYGQIDSN